MSCGCKKKNNEQTQEPTPQVTPVPNPQPTQEQVIKISTVLREMVENKKL